MGGTSRIPVCRGRRYKGLGIAVGLDCRWISLHLKILRQRALLLQSRRVHRFQQSFSPDSQGHAEGIANAQDFRIGVHFKLKTSYGATKTGWLTGAWDRTDVYSQGRAAADELFRTEGTAVRIHLRWQSRLTRTGGTVCTPARMGRNCFFS